MLRVAALFYGVGLGIIVQVHPRGAAAGLEGVCPGALEPFSFFFGWLVSVILRVRVKILESIISDSGIELSVLVACLPASSRRCQGQSTCKQRCWFHNETFAGKRPVDFFLEGLAVTLTGTRHQLRLQTGASLRKPMAPGSGFHLLVRDSAFIV